MKYACLRNYEPLQRNFKKLCSTPLTIFSTVTHEKRFLPHPSTAAPQLSPLFAPLYQQCNTITRAQRLALSFRRIVICSFSRQSHCLPPPPLSCNSNRKLLRWIYHTGTISNKALSYRIQ